MTEGETIQPAISRGGSPRWRSAISACSHENPTSPDALVGITLVALASDQNERQSIMAKAAVSADPKMGAAWVALGSGLQGRGPARRR